MTAAINRYRLEGIIYESVMGKMTPGKNHSTVHKTHVLYSIEWGNSILVHPSLDGRLAFQSNSDQEMDSSDSGDEYQRILGAMEAASEGNEEAHSFLFNPYKRTVSCT